MKIGNGLQKMGNLVARNVKRSFGGRGEEGSALVEFALTLPMLFGLIYLGAALTLGMYNLEQLGNATSNTAMAIGSDVGLYPNNDPCAYAEGLMTTSLPTWKAANFSYSLTISNASGTQLTPYTGSGSSFSCPLGSTTMGPNYPLVFTVSYTYSWLGIPAMPFFNAGLNNVTGTLRSSQPAIQM